MKYSMDKIKVRIDKAGIFFLVDGVSIIEGANPLSTKGKKCVDIYEYVKLNGKACYVEMSFPIACVDFLTKINPIGEVSKKLLKKYQNYQKDGFGAMDFFEYCKSEYLEEDEILDMFMDFTEGLDRKKEEIRLEDKIGTDEYGFNSGN